MLKIIKYSGIPIFMLSVILLNWLIPGNNELLYAIGPLASLGIGAATGFISSLFGESEEDARNRKRKEAIGRLNNMMKQNVLEGQQRKTQSDRQFGSATVDRRRAINDELYEQGLDPGTSIASNERDLVRGNISEKENIEDNVTGMNKNLQNQIGDLEAGMEDGPGWLEQGLGGAVSGGVQGLNIHSATSNMIQQKPNLPLQNSPVNPMPVSSDQGGVLNMSDDQMGKFGNVLNPFMSGEKSTFNTGNLIDTNSGLGQEDMASYYLKKYPFLKDKISLSRNFIQ